MLFFQLLLIRAFIPADIQAVITGPKFASNIYGYFSLKMLNLYPHFLSNFEYEQSSSSLQLLGIENVSTVANTAPILVFTLVIIIYTISVYPIRFILSKFRDSDRWSCPYKTLFWIVDRIWKMMMLGYFIRTALEMSQFILISSINEINILNTTNSYRIISISFSILMVLLFLIMIAFVSYLTATSYKLNENDHNKLGEFFFRGLKQDKKHRLYAIMLLIRRILFIIWIITLTMISSRFLISIILIIQLAYFVCLSYLRPYEQKKENLIEILNEIYYGILIIFLAFINIEDEWNATKTSIYMWMLASNTFIVFLIVLGKDIIFISIVFFIKTSITWIRHKCRLNEVSYKI